MVSVFVEIGVGVNASAVNARAARDAAVIEMRILQYRDLIGD